MSNYVFSQYYSLLIFVVTILITAASNHLLLYGLDINDYPGQYKKDEFISYTLYLFVEAIQRALEFLMLSIFILLSTKKKVYSGLNKIYTLFILFLFISPLLFFVDVIEIFIFTAMTQYLQINNRVGIGIVMLLVLLLYYVAIYIIVIRVSSSDINKIKGVMYFCVFIFCMSLAEFLIFEPLVNAIRA